MNDITELSDKMFSYKIKYSVDHGIDLDKRIIFVSQELTEDIGVNLRIKYDIIKQWWKHIERKPFSNIRLDISSFGGSIYAATSAIDFYEELKKEDNVLVDTKAHTICMSAATILLAGGTGTRMATKYCKHMIHGIQADLGGGHTQQLNSVISTLNEELLELFSFYVQFSNKDKIMTKKEIEKEAKKWIRKYTRDNIEYYLTSEEMKKLGLIDIVL